MARWQVMHEEGNCDLFTFSFFVEPWGKRLSPILGFDLDMLAVIRNGELRECIIPHQYKQAGEAVFSMLPAAFPRLVERTDYGLSKVQKLCERLEARSDYSKASDGELLALSDEYGEAISELNTWGMMITLMEYADNSFVSDQLLEKVTRHLESIGSTALATQVVSELGTPFEPTFLRMMRHEAVRLAKERRKGVGIAVGIDALWKKFNWLSYGYAGPRHPREFFEAEVDDLAEKTPSELSEIEGEGDRILLQQEKLIAGLRMPASLQDWLCIGRQFMFKKEYRKQLLYRAFAAIEPLHEEIARRKGLTLKELRTFTGQEFPAVLDGRLGKEEAGRRLELVAYVIENGTIRVLTGEEAQAFETEIIGGRIENEVSELRGQCAYTNGKIIAGPVRILMKYEEGGKVQPGDILVSHSTNPNMVTAMKRAAAIVTDQGGITCHAAIVSRELKIPCITGTKIATKALQDGERVEIDSAAGIIRRMNPRETK